MTLQEIVSAVETGNRFVFETSTCPKLTKKSRATGEPTDFTVEIRSRFTASVGVNYEDEVNDAREAQGAPRDFEAHKPAGKHHVDGYDWLLESDKIPGRFYIALSRFENRTTEYFVNGQKASAEQIADLKANYLPKPGGPSLVEWRTYGIESIASAAPAA